MSALSGRALAYHVSFERAVGDLPEVADRQVGRPGLRAAIEVVDVVERQRRLLKRENERAGAVGLFWLAAQGHCIVKSFKDVEFAEIRIGDVHAAVADDVIEVAGFAVNNKFAGEAAGHLVGVGFERVDDLVEIEAARNRR